MVKFAEVANQNLWWKYGEGFHIFDPNLLTFQNQRIRIDRKWLDLRKGDIGVKPAYSHSLFEVAVREVVAKPRSLE